MTPIYKYPRLYINAPFAENQSVALEDTQIHYLRNVLRKGEGDELRLFNGCDGEWIARIDVLSKKSGAAQLTEKIKDQPSKGAPIILAFSPIKKQRMDILIEKAVELGACEIYPILTNRTENRKLNMERMQAQIIEAAEQCERMTLPQLHEVRSFDRFIAGWKDVPLFVALERCEDAKPLSAQDTSKGGAFFIGPEGGFDTAEREQLLSAEHVKIVDLGETILRAETAGIACLSYARFKNLAK